MSDPKTKGTRDELYQKVWRSTLGKLVVELGTTHAELVRTFEELNVPRPDHSYWSRLRLNLSVAVPPLPEPTPTMALECLLRRKGAPGLQPVERTEAPLTKRAEEVPLPKPPTVPNVPKPKVVEFTRKELYEAIWSKPCVKLASELGISDVGLAKTCRRLGIPRPARGYWARIEAGEKLRKTVLSDAKLGQRDQVTFHVAENVARREEQALNYISTAGKGGKLEPVELPVEGVEIHPIAEKHQQALEKAEVGELGFVSIRSRNLFPSELTVEMIPLYARALHAVICELEDRDFEFTPGGGEYDGLQITRDGDHGSLRWSEAKLHLEREPTAKEKDGRWRRSLASSSGSWRPCSAVSRRDANARQNGPNNAPKPHRERPRSASRKPQQLNNVTRIVAATSPCCRRCPPT